MFRICSVSVIHRRYNDLEMFLALHCSMPHLVVEIYGLRLEGGSLFFQVLFSLLLNERHKLLLDLSYTELFYLKYQHYLVHLFWVLLKQFTLSLGSLII